MSSLLASQVRRIISRIEERQLEQLPSVWAEANRTLSGAVSAVQGKFDYNMTPYVREIIDLMSPYHPAKVVAIMKGSQTGFTEGLIMNGICYIIKHTPGNILLTSANDDLNQELVEVRLDQAISSTGIRDLIRPNVEKKRNNRSGDTSKYKEFVGGRLMLGGVNSVDKLSRQRSLKFGFFDDWDAAKIADKDQGDIFDIIQKRFSTHKNTMKQFYISTPETRPSNIENAYLLGDQRQWRVPCPCCGSYVELVWNRDREGERVGVVFQTNSAGNLDRESLGYVCQDCGQFWKESKKFEVNKAGIWVPTAEPAREGYYSYHISNLAAAPFMYGWKEFAEEWIGMHKDEGTNIGKLKVFMNQTLGEPFDDERKEIKANKLLENVTDYPAGVIPVSLAEKQGAGRILLLTCACDLNGVENDARLDYEVVAHTSTGSVYAIQHGSIGTYQPGNKKDKLRQRWTYRNNEAFNVWDYFKDEVIQRWYDTDGGGARMRIMRTAVDTGYYSKFAWPFINAFTDGSVIGVKGQELGDGKFLSMSLDKPIFKPSRSRKDLYILEVERIKDDLSERMELVWGNPDNAQPAGWIAFPQGGGTAYTQDSYFVQYEAETREVKTNAQGRPEGWKWVRKHSSAANHFFDCMVYNLAVRDIFADAFCRATLKTRGGWSDFVKLVTEEN